MAQDNKEQKQTAFNNIRVTLLDKKPLLAMVSVRVLDVIYVTGLRVCDGKKGIFVSMPSRKSGEEYQDICYPASKARRDELQAVVLEAYQKAKAEQG